MGKQEPNTNNSELKGLNSLTTLFFYLSILFFIIGFNFTDTPTPFGWYQQFMPNIGSRQISDITFIDSLNGFAVTNLQFILKTSNGGDNWTIVFNDTTGNIFKKVKFLNKDTGFVGGSIIASSLYYILKTTNAGTNWFYINSPFLSTYQDDLSVLNVDTIWTVESESLTGGVFRTTNGGASWQQQSAPPMDHIYMFNRNIGFVTNTQISPLRIYKTTNSGGTWNLLNNNDSFRDMYFIDSLKGWKAWGNNMNYTSDGGSNWSTQILPYGGLIVSSGIYKFSNVNKDTIWGSGGQINIGGVKGIIYLTTNGGLNWGYQQPDTSIHIFNYYHNKFVNKYNGWAYSTLTGIHTATGGDTTFLTGMKQISTEVPKTFQLFQNYPNPFNPATKMKYDIKRQSVNVRLIVYDITGKEVTILIDQKQNAGTYQVDFDGSAYSSGVYFYSLTIDGTIQDTKKMILLK